LLLEVLDADRYPTMEDLRQYVSRLMEQFGLPPPAPDYADRVAEQLYQPIGTADRLASIERAVAAFTRSLLGQQATGA
jgi:hypothetical protein